MAHGAQPTNMGRMPASPFAQVVDQAAGRIGQGAQAQSSQISFAPVYHVTIGSDIGPEQEERLRQILQEHDRNQRAELERLLND